MNIKSKLGIVLAVLFLSVSCNSKPALNEQEKSAIHVVSPTEFKEKSSDQLIIDIRTPQEFSEGHIKGAVNINLFDSTFLDQIGKYDKSIPIFLYCRSGNRTSSASAQLSKMGFVEIYDLKGGILNWARENFETIR